MPSIDGVTNELLRATALSSHLSCAHLTQLERQRRSGQLSVELHSDARLEAMRQRGVEHEAAFVEMLRSRGREIADLRHSRLAVDTVDAMRHGYGAIVQAPLNDDQIVGVADVLLRVERPSALGAYSYEPVETKLAQQTRPGTILQLCCYADAVRAIQGLVPEYVHVVTPIAEERYRTDQVAAYFRWVRRQFVGASSVVPPPPTYPDPVQLCEVCGYWKHCDARRRSDDHPSLIADIRTLQVREFQRQGLCTVAAIATTEGKLPKNPSRGNLVTYARLGHQAKLQIAARSAALPPVELLVVEPLRGLARLPEPSPADIFLDFEGDPFVGTNGLEYLTGYAFRDAAGVPRYTQHWSWDSASEKRACEDLIDFAMERLRQDPKMHIYHFGAYEPSVLKRLCARYETKSEKLDELLRGQRFIDLHAVVREAMRIGVERYGLKELEVLHGFSRNLTLQEAAVARRELELALEYEEPEKIEESTRHKVATYNSDDCLSTESLRNWLERQRDQLIGEGQDVQRPPLMPMQASEEVSERDLRIGALRDALLKDLPAERSAWTDEHQAKDLLASMLSYFRQEEKNAWWEHFRLRDLPVDEQLDEREMLAGLRFGEVLPKVGKERNARWKFNFPAQDSAVALGDRVYFTKAEDPSGERSTSLSVLDLDLVAGSVVLGVGKGAESGRPTTVLREQVVGAKALEDSLLGFAESVRDAGFQKNGRYAAAASLLLRRKPLGAKAGAALRSGEEPLIRAAERLCAALSHDALPIQGPPGSGKTYTGAHAILALAKAGKRVGITAVSHKVIDNLLQAIRRALPVEDDFPLVRLVHKWDSDENIQGVQYMSKGSSALAAIAPRTIVGGTAWLWADSAATEKLDYLFIDEAGQMALAQALAVARSARNIVLLGDPQQLEQPRRGAHPDGADVAALVHLIGKDRPTLADDQGLFLDSTYRLHPSICEFTSELYYERRLKPMAGLQLQKLSGHTPYAGAGLFLMEMEHEGNQAHSPEEVRSVVSIVESILRPGVLWTDRHEKTRPVVADDILVVAPYNAQVSALTAALKPHGVTRVGTVDRFQGQEAPIVVYSCTSSSPQDAPRGMPFLYDPHRFNVATSRAQGLVVVVANRSLFEPECRSPEQMQWANGLCRYREMAQQIPSAIGR